MATHDTALLQPMNQRVVKVMHSGTQEFGGLSVRIIQFKLLS